MSCEQAPRRQASKSAAVKARICDAVVACLVDAGYADTSINRVVELAGVSKGALQHHFRSKEDLMSATALHLLANASFLQLRSTRQPSAERSIARELQRTWQRGANTAEFRALLEILIRMRTDDALRQRLAPALADWHRRAMAINRAGYSGRSGGEEDVELLMALNACVIRGLVIQQQYTDDQGYLDRLMGRWIALVTPLLVPRDGNTPG